MEENKVMDEKLFTNKLMELFSLADEVTSNRRYKRLLIIDSKK